MLCNSNHKHKTRGEELLRSDFAMLRVENSISCYASITTKLTSQAPPLVFKGRVSLCSSYCATFAGPLPILIYLKPGLAKLPVLAEKFQSSCLNFLCT